MRPGEGLRRPLVVTRPVVAGLMAIFLLSLGGFPPMAGFVAKWYVVQRRRRAGQNTLAIVGVLTSVVSVFFYLRVVVHDVHDGADRTARCTVTPARVGRRGPRVVRARPVLPGRAPGPRHGDCGGSGTGVF